MRSTRLAIALLLAFVAVGLNATFVGGFTPATVVLLLLLSLAMAAATRGNLLLAWLAWRRGDLARMEERLVHGRDEVRHWKPLETLYQFLEGALRRERGDLAGARPYLERAIAYDWRLGLNRGRAYLYAAEAAFAAGDVEAARAYLRAARRAPWPPELQQQIEALEARLATGRNTAG
jgi:tetratricopeptide (TPR) repeat protein